MYKSSLSSSVSSTPLPMSLTPFSSPTLLPMSLTPYSPSTPMTLTNRITRRPNNTISPEVLTVADEPLPLPPGPIYNEF